MTLDTVLIEILFKLAAETGYAFDHLSLFSRMEVVVE